MKPTLIRQAAESDLQAISRLQQGWLEERSVYGFTPESVEQIRAALGPYFMVAEAGGEVVGFISGSVRSAIGMAAIIPEGASYLGIDNLYVSPEFRGRGLGSDLLTRSLARAKEQGVSYALLYSAAKDIHSILRFYEQHGFQTWSVQMFRKL